VAVEAETIGLPFAQAVISVTRTAQSTKEGAEPKPGERFFVTSLGLEERRPAQFAEHIRSHWGIENKNHWRRDAQWGEDAPRFKNPEAAQVLAILRGGLLALCVEPCPTLFARHQRHPRAAVRLINSPLQPLK
jgi:predicted transposase YbfD/YdcC